MPERKHARVWIFIHPYNMLCRLVCFDPVWDRFPWPGGREPCRILQTDFGEHPFHALR